LELEADRLRAVPLAEQSFAVLARERVGLAREGQHPPQAEPDAAREVPLAVLERPGEHAGAQLTKPPLEP
jgi:hypothetical protein